MSEEIKELSYNELCKLADDYRNLYTVKMIDLPNNIDGIHEYIRNMARDSYIAGYFLWLKRWGNVRKDD